MSLSKENPSKIGVMQKTGDAVKEKPFRTKGLGRLWDERLPRNDDKGHQQA